ncbi:MAG: inositol monophosphatase family protein, partial [Litorivicinus sp.]
PTDTVTDNIAHTADAPSWLVSLSGEENLRRGLPEFSLAVTRIEKGQTLATAIYSPMRQEQFTAGKGSGAGFQGRRVRGSGITRTDGAFGTVIGTDAPFLSGTLSTGDSLRDLALAATSRVDLAIAFNLDPEIRAPLALLFSEAGHLIGDRNGGPLQGQGGDLVAAPAKCFRTLIPELKKLSA